MRHRHLVIAAALTLAAPGAALAADPRYPDWPCAQIKVPEVSIAAVWAGPPIDDVASAWEQDPRSGSGGATRRAPHAAGGCGEEDFGGRHRQRSRAPAEGQAHFYRPVQHAQSGAQRGDEGIERFTRKQKEFADQIRSTVFQLRELQDTPGRDEGKVDELGSRIEWQTRIFEERQKTIGYVCEVPVLIEQPVRAGSAIAQSLE